MTSKSNIKTMAALAAAAMLTQFSLPASASSSSRYLKIRAHVGDIQAKPVTLPSGEVVDFPYVANALFYSEVFTHGLFEESNYLEEVLDEVSTSKTSSSSASNKVVTTVLSEDAKILQKYGLGNAVNSASTSIRGVNSKIQTDAAVGSDDPNDVANTPICEYNQPPVKLRGAVIAYQLAFGGGLTVGYDQSGNNKVPGGFSGSASIKSQRLDMQFDATDPLFSRTNQEAIIASVPVSKNVVDISASVTLNIGIPIGINFFMNGSIPKSIRSAIDKGLDAVATELQKQVGVWDKQKKTSWNDIYESRVVYSKLADYDNYVAIAGGKRAYVQVGDQFHIKNMYWNWAGKPCESRLQADTMASAVFGEAIGTVVEAGPYVSVLKVQPINGHEQGIRPGAYVQVEKLAN